MNTKVQDAEAVERIFQSMAEITASPGVSVAATVAALKAIQERAALYLRLLEPEAE